MSNETTKRLAPLLRKLRSRFADGAARRGSAAQDRIQSHGEVVLCALVRALLEWNAGWRVGASTYTRLCDCFVDLNELRVCSHEEFAAALSGHPAGADRAARLRACLADVYRREHAMSLAVLLEAPKREARHYLDSLDGVPKAVASRVAHEVLEIHAVSVDDRLRDLLEAERVIEPGTTAEHAAAELERAIAATDVKEAVALLLAWADEDWRPALAEAQVKASKSGIGASRVGEDATKHAGVGSSDAGGSSGPASSASAGRGASGGSSSSGSSGQQAGKASKGKESSKEGSKDAAKGKVPATAKSKVKQGAKGASNARGRSAKK